MEDDEIEDNNYELLYKVIIIGDTCVGKSNILSRYIKDEFREDSKSTVGVELGTKFLKIKIQEQNYKYGIQLGKKDIDLLQVHIIKVLMDVL